MPHLTENVTAGDNAFYHVDNLRIRTMRPLIPPAILIEELPLTRRAVMAVRKQRKEIKDILLGKDDRLIVISGPCSIHDPLAALEYARALKKIALKHRRELCVIMRVYFEKPRTVGGWKGLINDPYLNDSFHINAGLRLARGLLLDVIKLGLPTATEFLDTIIPQFIADAVAWAAIGARTTESQVHRELSSGLSMPVGFKNGTGGNVRIAIDAIRSARQPHWFPSVTKQGVAAIFSTGGNDTGHLILRGGERTGPNYGPKAVKDAAGALHACGLPPRLIVDCSHGNSRKDYLRQASVANSLIRQIAGGETAIAGVMLESNLLEGKQDAPLDGKPLQYGKSITDACISLECTAGIMDKLAAAVTRRRAG